MTNIPQHFLFTLLSNVGPLAFGLHTGWLGPFEGQMKGNSSKPLPYEEPLSSDQISWLGGLLPASMLISTPFYGLLLQKMSYKPITVFCNIIHSLTFALYIVPDVRVAYAARFAGGFASIGSIVITPLYVNECVRPSYRGFLGALSSLSITFGVAVAFIAGSYTPFLITNIVCLSCSLLFFLGVFWMPDSPVWLVMHKKLDSARKSLLKLRCASEDEAEREIAAIQGEVDMKLSVKSAGLCTILKDRVMRKAMFLAMGMMVIQQATGITPMQFYFQMVLKDEAPFAASAIAVVQLLAAVAGAFLLGYAGRKRILLVSTAIIFASYTYLWLILDFEVMSTTMRLVALLVYFASYNTGLGTIPFVMLPEILPQRARAVSVAVVGLVTGLTSFSYAKLFPSFIAVYPLKYAILIFAAASFLGTVFIALCLFETRKKSASEINDILQGANPSRSLSANRLISKMNHVHPVADELRIPLSSALGQEETKK